MKDKLNLDLLELNKPSNKELFFIHRIMPCCSKPKRFFQNSRVSHFINISCFHCGYKWRINSITQIIEHFYIQEGG